MNLQKIITYVAAAVGVISIIFLIRIIGAGDSAIEQGGDSIVNPLMYIAYVIFAIALFFVLIFTLKNLLTNTASLKSTLMGVGAFLLLLIICYFGFAKGEVTPLRDGDALSANGSRWVGAGLYMFYCLAAIAGGAMLFTGIKKMLK
ncbi:hypothetical protein [Mangrovimonas aestuarii]|uniref:hypothetical protein n=1 Tax=Mangrovimonas aestuarii TaxID=3018443 RepID=UPI0023796601|nr:hypothetical protein [Mangrovimonas aestuarii]